MPSVVSQSVIVGVLLLLWLFMSSDASLSSCRGLVTIEIHPFYLMGERRRIKVSIIISTKAADQEDRRRRRRRAPKQLVLIRRMYAYYC